MFLFLTGVDRIELEGEAVRKDFEREQLVTAKSSAEQNTILHKDTPAEKRKKKWANAKIKIKE